ncbi:cell division cycle 7-related protein kinase-like [Mizuhopecten yessoensis]|nr:cell division cycle 7-related protein kinase-like [Mizuhopecten yessoensis]XP_021380365.1 cell division cycle 7-related protein kinase-like [Mizuhopecten yessoensis]XP_021380366.1 cell division cycle 7-related protein kinase-like [Mizuhopecten yessoensis]
MSSTDDVHACPEDYSLSDHGCTPKRKKSPPPLDSLPVDVQEEIGCMYEFLPEIADHFVVLNKIGEGTFSSVFLAKLKHYSEVKQLFALKHIIPTSHPSRIEGELKCLQEIGGCDNVMGVELCIRNKDHVVIVMPYFPHEKFQDYVQTLSVPEVRDYMRNLLLALRRVHQFDIIHRDVKPSNFLYDQKTKQYALVDFGLAHKAPISQAELAASHRKVSQSTSISSSRSNSLSPSKRKVLTPTQEINLQNIQDFTQKIGQTPSPGFTKLEHSQTIKCRQFTPPTPDIANKVFTKRVKSPRRMLLAKRALMVKERETNLTRTGLSHQGQSSGGLSTCQCFGQPIVCTLCTARSNQQAPRAGTPGFRSPEVLMKCPDQSTAVDIWSAGVIFLSLLSGRYPFFRANDDLTALAQIISIMGSEEVVASASTYGKKLLCNPPTHALNLKNLCNKLRTGPSCRQNRSSSKHNPQEEVKVLQSWASVPDSVFDLLHKLLDLNPSSRITAEEALNHTFFSSGS